MGKVKALELEIGNPILEIEREREREENNDVNEIRMVCFSLFDDMPKLGTQTTCRGEKECLNE
jgi:hypothetical protein